MGFPRQEYCNGLPFPSPGDLPIALYLCSAHFSLEKNTVPVPLAGTAPLEVYESEAMLAYHFSAVILDGLSYQVSPLLT